MKSSERQLITIFVILGILLIGLIVGIMYYKKSYETSFFTYHNFDFRQVRNGYEITLFINERQTPQTITLRSDPRELEDIPIDASILQLNKKKDIFATINPYDNLTGVTTMAVLELDKIIDNPSLYNIPVNASFTEPYSKSGLVVRTCADANDEIAILWFRLENETRIYRQDDCFIIAGVKEDDFIRDADRILYTLLGVMKP